MLDYGIVYIVFIMIIILMGLNDYSESDRKVVVNGIVTLISCHKLLGSVGRHRGVFLSARDCADYLPAVCDEVNSALKVKGIRDTQIVPIDLRSDTLDEKVKMNGWSGIVLLDVDNYFSNLG